MGDGEPSIMIYGYARVSTGSKSEEAARVAAFKKAGAGRVFREVAQGDKTDRAQLRRLLDRLDAGDVLMVTRLDGLEAGLRSLADTWGEAMTAHGRLMLTVVGGLAEFEKELIRARTGEGRTRAKARVKLGRKPKLADHQKREAIRHRDRDGEPVRAIARSYNVSHSTISRLPASTGAPHA